MLVESETMTRDGGIESIGPDTRIDDYFRTVVAQAPDRTALVTSSGESYTYADIDRWSDAVAADIAARNAPLERPIAIVTASIVALVPCLIAAVKAGHFYVMIDATDPGDRISLLLRDAGVTLCVVDSVDDPPAALEGVPLVGIRPFPVENPETPPQRPRNPLLHVIYTSGTTGKPKAVAMKQAGIVAEMVDKAKRWGSGPDIRQMYNVLPGYVRSDSTVFRTLLIGATLCAFDLRNESLRSMAEFIARERVELLTLTPSLFRRLVAAIPDGLDFSSVRRLRMGADRVTVADIEAYKRVFPRGVPLWLGFASTETSGVFGMEVNHDTPVPGPDVPMGCVVPGVEVRLVDEQGNEVPVGETGEIIVRSRSVIEGYWNDPVLTAERFEVDPEDPSIRTFRTGDLAKRDADGLYYFVGRKDARLKIHGRRIDPSEVETALLATGVVREAVIVGKNDARGDQELVAYVVTRDGKPCAPGEIRRLLRGRVPVWMIPARIHGIDEIPMTSAAKVDRAALVARVDEIAPDDDGAADPLEQQLVEIWSRVIGQPVHVDDDFFDDLGGESLMAAHIVTDVETATGKSIAPSLLLELNTVAKMAEYIRGADEAVRHVIEVQKGTGLPVLFCVAGGGGGVINFRPLAAALGPDQPFWGLQTHEFDLETMPKTFTGIAAAYIHAARRVQPKGPYLLLGYSSGGKLAYEIARQLLAAGERVGLLGLLDTGATMSRVSVWQRLRNRYDILVRNPERARAFAKEAAMRPSKWMMNSFIQKLLGRGIAVPPKIIENTMMVRGVSRDYALPPYPGKLTLFLARNGMRQVRVEKDLGWGSLVNELEIVEVDGDHETMLKPAHIESLATAVKGSVARALEQR